MGDKLTRLKSIQRKSIKVEGDIELILFPWNLDLTIRCSEYLSSAIGDLKTDSQNAFVKWAPVIQSVIAETLFNSKENGFDSIEETEEFVSSLGPESFLILAVHISNENLVPLARSLGIALPPLGTPKNREIQSQDEKGSQGSSSQT